MIPFKGSKDEVSTKEVFAFGRKKSEMTTIARQLFPWMLQQEHVISQFDIEDRALNHIFDVLDGVTGEERLDKKSRLIYGIYSLAAAKVFNYRECHGC